MLIIAIAGARMAYLSNQAISEPNGDNGDKANKGTN